jgi:hypothetical protein
MSHVIAISDGGSARIKCNGRLFQVGIIIVRESENESLPVDFPIFCLGNKAAAIKCLKHEAGIRETENA